MKQIVLMIIFLALMLTLFALDDFSFELKVKQIPDSETKSSKALAAAIKKRFSGEEECLKALYIWIATRLTYDYEHINDYKAPESNEKLIQNTLSTRKAVCQGYAELFTDTAINMGISAYTIFGYSRQDESVSDVSHGWVAVRFKNGDWFLNDPTWGSGYVSQDHYVKSLSYQFYKVPAEEFIKTHMPFDPIWQLLSNPVSHYDFYQMTFDFKTKGRFNFNDSINVYLNQNDFDKLKHSFRRIKKRGVINNSISEYLRVTSYNLDVHNYNKEVTIQNEAVTQFNACIKNYNQAIIRYNNYLKIKNSGYSGFKPADILKILADLKKQIIAVEQDLINIKNNDKNMQNEMIDLMKSIQELIIKNNKEIAYVKGRFKLK